MLERILRHLRNWFVVSVHSGKFTVENGSITLPFLQDGQYFRVCGSVFNDGVYKRGEEVLRDETFNGEVWALAIPDGVLLLEQDITAWEEKHSAANGPYASESFGGYTYTKATDGKTGGSVTWEVAFRSRLNAWRKI
jgi:hypothetical protein